MVCDLCMNRCGVFVEQILEKLVAHCPYELGGINLLKCLHDKVEASPRLRRTDRCEI